MSEPTSANPWGRAIVISLHPDGEVTFRYAGEPESNPLALIVFGVDTPNQAQELQARFCSLHRDGSGRYHFGFLSTRKTVISTREALRGDIDADDSAMVTRAFEQYFEKVFGGPEQIPQTLAEIEHRECRDHPGETYTADTPCPACK